MSRLQTRVSVARLVDPVQAGFTPYRDGCRENIFILSETILNRKQQGLDTYTCFVDIVKAYDRVDRNLLWVRLQDIGIPAKMIRAIKGLYEDVSSCIEVNGKLSAPFHSNNGLMQGCVLSPLLFNIFLDAAVSNINIDALPGVPLGINELMATKKLNILLYADDIVLIADSPIDLQLLMDALYQQMFTWRLEINTETKAGEDKSNVVVFTSRRNHQFSTSWNFNGRHINESNSYTYLGIIFSSNMSWNPAIRYRLECASSKASILPRLRYKYGQCPIKIAETVYRACVGPALDFGCEIWNTDLNPSLSDEIELSQINIGRDFLGASPSSQPITIRGELGWMHLSERFDDLRLRLWHKCATLDPPREYGQSKQHSDVAPQQRSLLHATYIWSKQCNSAWWVNTRRILDECDLSQYYSPHHLVTDPAAKLPHISQWTPIVSEAIKVRAEVNWQTELANLERKEKLDTYIRIKQTFKRERYIDEVSDPNMRRYVFQLRTGTCSKLWLEGARMSSAPYIPRHERTCRCCYVPPGSPKQLDDSMHFLIECPAFERFRSQLLIALNAEHATHLTLPTSISSLNSLDQHAKTILHDVILGGSVTDHLTDYQYFALMHATKSFLFQSFAVKSRLELPYTSSTISPQ